MQPDGVQGWARLWWNIEIDPENEMKTFHVPKTSPDEEAADMLNDFKKVNNHLFHRNKSNKWIKICTCRERVKGISQDDTNGWGFMKLMYSLKRLYYILYFQ